MARYDARKLRNGMKYEISNEYLKVKADTEGAILWSVTDKDGFEYIWQEMTDTGTSMVPIFFPILPDYGRNPTYFREDVSYGYSRFCQGFCFLL